MFLPASKHLESIPKSELQPTQKRSLGCPQGCCTGILSSQEETPRRSQTCGLCRQVRGRSHSSRSFPDRDQPIRGRAPGAGTGGPHLGGGWAALPEPAGGLGAEAPLQLLGGATRGRGEPQTPEVKLCPRVRRLRTFSQRVCGGQVPGRSGGKGRRGRRGLERGAPEVPPGR